jgi:hypothetical protein
MFIEFHLYVSEAHFLFTNIVDDLPLSIKRNYQHFSLVLTCRLVGYCTCVYGATIRTTTCIVDDLPIATVNNLYILVQTKSTSKHTILDTVPALDAAIYSR